MKKLFFIVVCCVYVHSLCASECLEGSIIAKSAEDNFLYESTHNYIIGQGYECGNVCGNGTTVTMFAGHLWKGEQVNEIVTYKCDGNKWNVISNDVVGEIVANMWCDAWTKSGDNATLGAAFDEDRFNEIKSLLINANESNQYATELSIICTDEGWANPKVIRCEVPYVANDEGICEHYTKFLDSLYVSDDENHRMEVMGNGLAAFAAYIKYRKGTFDIEQTKEFMLKDPALQGRFSE